MVQGLNDLIVGGNPYVDYFHELIKAYGANFATGVPCGVLRHFIHNLSQDGSFLHLPGLNEPETIAISAGAWLGGKNPVLYMQNSGMLESTNAIGSLLMPSNIPALMILEYRGCPGEDATQHFLTGGITKNVLDNLGIFHVELDEDNIEEAIRSSYLFMNETNKPAAILVKRGWANGWSAGSVPGTSNDSSYDSLYDSLEPSRIEDSLARIKDLRDFDSVMMREEALDAIMESINNDVAVISTTGLISRSLYDRHHSPNQFYNAGGFGLVSSIGLGFAASRPDVRTVVVDGDASLLSNLGSLATIGNYGPKNLTHIVIDNNAYGSCSEEQSVSHTANLPAVAALEGYSHVFMVDSYNGLREVVEESASLEGPIFVHAKIKLGGRRDFKRPLDMSSIAKKFKEHFGTNGI